MSATGLTTAYFSSGSGAPSTAPSVASGEYALYQDTATGNLYEWNLSGTPAWSAVGGGPRGKLGYVQITSSLTTTSTAYVDATGLTLTVTATARSLKITFYSIYVQHSVDTSTVNVALVDTSGPTSIQAGSVTSPATPGGEALCLVAVVTPGAGSKTYKVQFQVATAGTATIVAATAGPAFLLIEEI